MTLQKPSSSVAPFVTSTIYSVLTMWTLEITSAQFTRQNCNLRTLPHLLLKCAISTHISRQAVQTHLSLRCVYISQLVRYARICTSKVDFMNRLRGLSLRLRQQACLTNLLQRTFTKFFNRYGLIVVKYGATLRVMRFAIQA